MLNDLKRYVRVETVLLILAAVAAGGLFYVVGEKGSVEDEGAELRSQKLQTETTLQRLGDDKFLLERELEEFEAKPDPVGFPSRSEALTISKSLAAYISENGLSVSAFDSNQTIATLDEARFEAINFSLIAEGRPDALIGMLGLVDEVPTAIVKDLELTRTSDDPDIWQMSLGLFVMYGNQIEGGS